MKIRLLICFLFLYFTSLIHSATYIVDNNGDADDGLGYTAADGTNTLRKCIRLANANNGADVINFNIAGAGPHTIILASSLPSITDNTGGVTIDGTTQSGWTANTVLPKDATAASPMNAALKIILSNDAGFTVQKGLVITSNNNIIKGLVLQNFGLSASPGSVSNIGIEISGNLNQVIGCYVGIDVTGTTTTTRTVNGIYIIGGSNNIIGDGTAAGANIVSGMLSTGIQTFTSGTGNILKGNMIGLQKDGATVCARKNGGGILFATNGNTIGGTAAGDANVISGNTEYGIAISGNSNTVIQNIIGPRADGSTIVTSGMQTTGIAIDGGDHTIGGSSAAYRNIISANTSYGVLIGGDGTNNIAIKGNYIGLAKNGASYISSSVQDVGISIGQYKGGATRDIESTIIGGTSPGESNVISGNVSYGVLVEYVYPSNDNWVYGNIIGLQSNGTSIVASANQQNGVGIRYSYNTWIGGNTASKRNIISGNTNTGIYIFESAFENYIEGNYVGLQSNGTTVVSSSSQNYGVYIETSSYNNVIGGSAGGQGNLISGQNNGTGSGGYGIYCESDDVNFFYGNTIGPQADGSTNVASNAQDYGIYLTGAAEGHIIGGSTSNARNIISANLLSGVYLEVKSCIIKGNYIGIASNGISNITSSSQDYGINIAGGSSNVIGGTATGEGNLISGNFVIGIWVQGGSSSNIILGNIIGPQKDASTLVSSPMQGGGVIFTGNGNILGGNSSGARNIISGNTAYGVGIAAGSTSNTIKGNYIGIASDGNTFITGNSQEYGILLLGTSNTIGGTAAGEGNLISGNADDIGSAGYGIWMVGAITNTIAGNIIGPRKDGSTLVPGNDQEYGIYIQTSSVNNIVGGSTSSSRNIISANNTTGIYITDASTTGNSIKGNYIGIASNGTSFITSSTQDYGIYLTNSARSNTIGGTAAGEGNIISGNYAGTTTSGAGIFTNSTHSSGNTIIGNYIGTTSSGNAWFTNNQVFGIEIIGSPNNTIGGSSSAYRNVISANGYCGVKITGAGSTGNRIKGNYIGLAANGTSAVASSSQDIGINLAASASSNTIGGSNSGEGNVISGNTEGISLYDATSNYIFANTIGPQSNGTSWLTNSQTYGISITDGAHNNVIGGSSSAFRNVISANGEKGISVSNAGTGNIVKGNYIGLAANGTSTIASSNQDEGIFLAGAGTLNVIGGTNTGEGNVISGNDNGAGGGIGIYLYKYDAGTYNTIIGNIIGPQANGTSWLTNNQDMGIYCIQAFDNIIGGSTAAHRNIISANGTYGIHIAGSGSDRNKISGNYMGPGSGGASIAGASQNYGVYIDGSDNFNNIIGGTIGSGTSNPEGNVIAYNADDGIFIDGSSDNNLISKNLIYSNTNKAVNLNGSGNSDYTWPTINPTYNATTISGTAAANDIVDVFKKVAGGTNHCQQSQTYLGTTTANGSGIWTFSPGGTILNAGDTPLATARENGGYRTSEINCPSTAVGLPIELLSFNAKKINATTVKTYWQTVTEINNDYFTVQRSTDAVEFDDIGIVDGAGNSSSILSYELFDNNFSTLNFPTLYYRLKQTDFDGSYSYSNIVAVNFGNTNSSISNFNIFPNPTTGENINISLTADINSEVLIIVRDILGKELYAKVFMTDKEYMIIRLSDGFFLPAGIYTVIASSNDKLVSKKIVVK